MRKKEGDKFSLILDAAAKVFCRVGFDGAQVAAIAAEGGVATGSVYLYFRSKDEVLERLFERHWSSLRIKFRELPALQPVECLRAQLGLFFDSLAQDRDLGMVFLKEHHRFLERQHGEGYNAYQECVGMGLQAFERGVRKGIFPVSTDVPMARAFLFGGVHAALAFLYANPDRSPQEVREGMLGMALASIAYAQGG